MVSVKGNTLILNFQLSLVNFQQLTMDHECGTIGKSNYKVFSRCPLKNNTKKKLKNRESTAPTTAYSSSTNSTTWHSCCTFHLSMGSKSRNQQQRFYSPRFSKGWGTWDRLPQQKLINNYSKNQKSYCCYHHEDSRDEEHRGTITTVTLTYPRARGQGTGINNNNNESTTYNETLDLSAGWRSRNIVQNFLLLQSPRAGEPQFNRHISRYSTTQRHQGINSGEIKIKRQHFGRFDPLSLTHLEVKEQ